MNILVGYTGFVGSNLYATGKFDAVYNSKNIQEAYGTSPDILFYAGLRAEKYLANSFPEKDKMLIVQAEKNIKKINPGNVVLISTIDVFKDPKDVNEKSVINTKGLPAYGYHRYQLELWVREYYKNALIVRLPALFGKNIKKNFIYDYINIIPYMLKENKMKELQKKNPELKKYYKQKKNGYFQVNNLSGAEKEFLKRKFKEIGFSALNFTDSRNIYQFYNLQSLWKDIQTALFSGIKIWHPATEPVSTAEIYNYLTGEKFVNILNEKPLEYNYKTIYADVFGGHGWYISDKKSVLKEIQNFVMDKQ